ncbi:sensor histidine kinase [Nocardia sp. NPDC051750]|uniref:sensor histidine kinase n=1 Tax=Nocardia sp. NPDC051750 TaxID=3364325 RepID=UPI00379F7E9A
MSFRTVLPPSARVSGFLDRRARTDIFGAGGRRGWFGALLAVIWLAYLATPVLQLWRQHDQPSAVAATVALAGYGVLIVVALAGLRGTDPRDPASPPAADRRVWPVLAAMVPCAAVLVVVVGAAAVPAVLYIAIVAVLRLPARASGWVCMAVVLAILLPALAVPRLAGVPVYVAFLPVFIWAVRQIGQRGARLTQLARRQQAELAVAGERNRVARDVHDILGHSLTVITVKTELAQRLMDLDADRAKAELADVERLAREALTGVRDTVGGLREVTLRGELANARSALTAADIAADLPDPARLPAGNHELFGWVLREAVTNVVRHSAARRCAVTVTPTRIEVTDDGRGLRAAAAGSGLAGLRERTRAAGGTLTLSEPAGGGVRVAVTVPG